MESIRLNTNVSFFTTIQEDIAVVEALMRAQTDGYHSDLKAALDLILKSGGKRIRPNMTLIIGSMLGGPKNRLITLAAAIELLHTATLVHDDLIDGSLLRRGVPTLNSQWTPGATVLTGDFLFACAARLAAETDSVPVMKLFSRTLAVIVNGEISQMFNDRCVADHNLYLKRIYAKTASLFETSSCSAALISTEDQSIIEHMRKYGYEIGVAFQIIDDILDFTGEQATVGKPVGSDLHMGLITLPTIHYLEENPSDPDAQLLLSGKCLNIEQVERLIYAIRNSKAINRAHAEAKEYVERGLKELDSIPLCAERQSLSDLARYIVEREI
jgi:geranylgeranyl pyrophosphate synthase